MTRDFTLEYWLDDGWYIGRLLEIPGIFSQGETFHDLEENIREVYQLMKKDMPKLKRKTLSKRLVFQD